MVLHKLRERIAGIEFWRAATDPPVLLNVQRYRETVRNFFQRYNTSAKSLVIHRCLPEGVRALGILLFPRSRSPEEPGDCLEKLGDPSPPVFRPIWL